MAEFFGPGISYTGLSVVFYCHDGRGRVVMNKRGASSRDEQGLWDIGGGAVKQMQHPETTLRTEVMEEYGCDVLEYEFLGYRSVVRPAPPAAPRFFSHWVTLDFKVLVDPKQVRNGELHKLDAVRLVKEDRLPPARHLHSQLPLFLHKYRDKVGALLPTGTSIRFKDDLVSPADGDHPTLTYASRGELGVVLPVGRPKTAVAAMYEPARPVEGYWVKTLTWPHKFGAKADEFDVVTLE